MEKKNWLGIITVSVIILVSITFITLKLFGIIPWNWWMVTIVLWGSASLKLLYYIAMVVMFILKLKL